MRRTIEHQADGVQLSDSPARHAGRGVQGIQNVGGAQPQTSYKAFNWDQSYRKAIAYTAAPDDKEHTPLWRVDDPLKAVAPSCRVNCRNRRDSRCR